MGRKWLVAMLVLSAVGLAACGSSSVGSGGGDSKVSTVDLGYDGQLSGPETAFGQAGQEGIQAAIHVVNAQKGVHFKLTSFDDTSQTQQALANVQRMLVDHIQYIFGPNATELGVPAAPAIAKAGALQFSTVADSSLETSGSNSFGVTVTVPQEAQFDAQYLKKLGVTRVAVVAENSAYGLSGLKAFQPEAKSLGMTVVDSEEYAHGDTSFSEQAAKIVAAKPQGIFLSGYYTESALLRKALVSAGLPSSVQYLGISGTHSPQFISIAKSAANGTLVDVQLPGNNGQFTQATAVFKKMFGHAPQNDELSMTYYDSVRWLAAAINAVGDNPAAVKKWIESRSFSGVFGQERYVDRRLTVPLTVLKVVNGQYEAEPNQ